MSGGSFNYEYCKIKELYVGEMQDADLDEMMKDLCNVLHDLEWWQSADYDEETYRHSTQAFKQKWLRGYNWKTEERRGQGMIQINDDDLPITVANKIITGVNPNNPTSLAEDLVKAITGGKHASENVDMFDLEEIKEIADYLIVYYKAHKNGD